MLYTTYYNNMKNLPQDYIKIIISLYPPKWIKIDNSKNIFHSLSLAPNPNDFNEFQKTKNYDAYFSKIIQKIQLDINSIDLINNILIALSHNKNIVLICYEKDYTQCHRYLLAKYLKETYNIEWQEI